MPSNQSLMVPVKGTQFSSPPGRPFQGSERPSLARQCLRHMASNPQPAKGISFTNPKCVPETNCSHSLVSFFSKATFSRSACWLFLSLGICIAPEFLLGQVDNPQAKNHSSRCITDVSGLPRGDAAYAQIDCKSPAQGAPRERA
jgi:hypothetical protein